MKCLTIIGARPQFVKAAVVSRAIRQNENIEEIIVHTGQHYDNSMSDLFFAEMSIPKPKYNLGICNLSHGAMTGQMLEQIEKIIWHEQPDIVLVYGDTNSTLAGALAAKKLHVKVAHVEAGLRSFNMNMPEEINRILTDRISDILFCPTQTAMNNLQKEGLGNMSCQILNCGDVMYDAATFYASQSRKPTEEIPPKFILCTVHRAENTDNEKILRSILKALEQLSENIPVLIPLHPRTKAKLTAIQYDFDNSKIHFIAPVGYLEMIFLLQHCELVMTDSGGLQKEAYFFHRNCVTLRNETEWIELVTNGFNSIAGVETDNIICTVQKVMKQNPDYSVDLYGDGNAGQKIVNHLSLCCGQDKIR